MTAVLAGTEAAPMLASIHSLCFPERERWDAAAMASLLQTAGTIGLVERSEGLGLFRASGSEAEVLTLGVVPSARRRGVGRRLLEAGLEWCAALGAEAMFLEVARKNAAARALYERAGFTIVGSRRRYYDSGEDALVMRVELAVKPVALP